MPRPHHFLPLPLPLPLLLLILLAPWPFWGASAEGLLPRLLAHRRPAPLCPRRCAVSRAINLTLAYPRLTPVAVSQLGESPCRRACFHADPQFSYYVHNPQGSSNSSCFCSKTCGFITFTAGADFVRVGRLTSCADFRCPVTCQATDGAGRVDISSPLPSQGGAQATVAACVSACRNASATFYSYCGPQDGCCKCFSGCSATQLQSNSPSTNALGYIPSCPIPAPPPPPRRVCTAPGRVCPKCPGVSFCTGNGLLKQRRCCCVPPNRAVVINGIFKDCIASL